jgi:hypothetical protein
LYKICIRYFREIYKFNEVKFLFESENQDRSNLILFRKDQSGKYKMLLVGNLIAYDQINILFECPRHDKECYCHVDYIIMDLTQREWVRVRK